MEREALRLRIHGRVQGVGYRYWMGRQAEVLGLSGWVRNRRDGTVEALIAGSEQAVRAMIEQCSHGPEAAHVERVEQEPAADVVSPGFESLPTA